MLVSIRTVVAVLANRFKDYTTSTNFESPNEIHIVPAVWEWCLADEGQFPGAKVPAFRYKVASPHAPGYGTLRNSIHSPRPDVMG